MKKNIKNVLCIIMCLSMLTASMFVSNAAEYQDQEEEVQIDVLDDGLNPDDYVEANAALVQRGRQAMLRRTGVSLDVTHYYQSGQTWSDDVMQTCNKTIGKSGCCLTSFAMIQRYLGGTCNPGEVNTILGDNACPFDYQPAAEAFGYTITNKKRGTVTDDYAIEFIIGSIDSGLPVLVGMVKDSNSNSTHFVTAYGYDGTTIYIHDPASSRDYTELSQYLENYYVNRLYVYANAQ